MPDELEDRIAAAMIAAWRGRAVRAARGEVLEIDGLVLAITNLPADDLNVTLVERQPADPVGALRLAEAAFRARGRAFGLKLVVGRFPAVESAVRQLGLEMIVSEPVMVLPVTEAVFQDPPPGAAVRRVTTTEELAALVEIEVAVFGTERRAAEGLVPPSLLTDPAVRAYLGTLDGEPVAAAYGHLHERTLGVFGVGTLEHARRRGIGTAVTSLAVHDHRDVADVVWLEPSELGRSVYERIGFRSIGDAEVWVRGR